MKFRMLLVKAVVRRRTGRKKKKTKRKRKSEKLRINK
jgi:hypothetical protein